MAALHVKLVVNGDIQTAYSGLTPCYRPVTSDLKSSTRVRSDGVIHSDLCGPARLPDGENTVLHGPWLIWTLELLRLLWHWVCVVYEYVGGDTGGQGGGGIVPRNVFDV